MKNLRILNICSLFISLSAILFSQSKVYPKEIIDKMHWLANAKLGIFIHAEIYAVDGIEESWSFHNKKISRHHDEVI